MNKNVLVTGAGGYIGSVLIPKLLKKGYKVKAVDRYFFGEDKLNDNENLVKIKEDTRRLKEEIFADVDFVIDLVAISNDPSGEVFREVTFQINHISRVRTANIAKKMGVKRYILPSSCSIYGFQKEKVSENSKTNPLTTYAIANERAEKGVLSLADDNFCVTIMRQSTVFGYSPRMRFDLAINGMTYGAWESGKLPLMRDGSQYRPMIHVEDTTDVMCLLLETEKEKINGEIFNIGGDNLNYQIGLLGEIIADVVGKKLGKKVEIEWYGDPDHRSYYVDFSKIKNILEWTPKWDAKKGAEQIVDKLENGELEKTIDTITLNWYQELIKWYKIIKSVEKYGGILEIV